MENNNATTSYKRYFYGEDANGVWDLSNEMCKRPF